MMKEHGSHALDCNPFIFLAGHDFAVMIYFAGHDL